MTFSRRKFIRFGISAGLTSCVQPTIASDTCKKEMQDIFVGGVTGFDSLADPSNTALLRKTCRVGLYVHGYVWTRTPADEHKAVLSVFKDTPMEVELGLAGDAQGWFEHGYKPKYIDQGIRTKRAHVNGLDSEDRLDVWKRFVGVARTYGLETISPIFSPNSRQYMTASFSSPIWNFLREGATIGGALTTDSPPHYFLQQPDAYRQFILDELTWAKHNGLRATFIISPNNSGMKFLDDTKRTVEYLVKHNAVPDAWIVENYNAGANPAYANKIGSESNEQNILGVALWLSKNAP
ncbi:hypothetical protein [Burkholderia pseudomultivorans]|uniref:Uncharacterized protein n=1 Tax=Burkholderia cenocepacia TaxID=95486 RepID=A0AAN0VLU0_9BURK|nr:hypothetical protein [Burkholderia pseudomultivorans]AIO32076.1 hypothetical protein DM39_591 [Burkholderia cenocepacia]